MEQDPRFDTLYKNPNDSFSHDKALVALPHPRSSHLSTENILKLLQVSQRFCEAIKTGSGSDRPVLHPCSHAGGAESWPEMLLGLTVSYSGH